MTSPKDYGWVETDALLSSGNDPLILAGLVSIAVEKIAEELNGLNASTKDKYKAFLCPPDFPTNDVLKQSGCGLTVMAVMRLLGIDDELLYIPYTFNPAKKRFGAIADVLSIGKKNDTFYDPPTSSDNGDPGFTVGDVVHIWGPPNRDHVFTITSIDPTKNSSGHYVFNALHGGQGINGYQALKHKPTYFAWVGGVLQSTDGRVMKGYVDMLRIPRTKNAWLPEKWLENVQ